MTTNRVQTILASTVGRQKPVEKEDFAKAAEAAKEYLNDLRAEAPLESDELLAFHKAWYMFAGHRHLGRIYVEMAKEL
jgi:hypothetical protein